jgi:hypothetical protein
MDAQYTNQNNERAFEFIEYVISYLQKQTFSVYILDRYNLTMDAQTSDGFHFLSNVILHKVYFILHLAT